jgi:CsbD-like
MAMAWDQMEGNWKQFKGKVKEQWGKLTDDDLDVIAGKRDLARRLSVGFQVDHDESKAQSSA